MNKLVLGLAVASVIGLSGCSDSPKEPAIPDGTPGTGASAALTKPVYIPADGNIPLPNDLLFSGTENLTLNPPVADPSDLSDPLVAASSLDGWSTNAAFSFSFSNTEGTDLNPSTVVPGSTVRVYEVDMLLPEAVPGSGILVPSGPVTGVVRELTPGAEFVATYAGPLTVAVIPTAPLKPRTGYMVVVTDGITDANGNNIIADGQYAIAKRAEPIPAGGPTSALEPVRQLVNAMEIAAADAGQPRENIMMSFQFTTQSVGTVVGNTKLAFIDAPFAAGAQTPSSFSSLMTDLSPFTQAPSSVMLYKGQVALNYFLTAPDSLMNQSHPGVANPTSVLDDFFLGVPAFPDGQGGTIPNPFAGDVTTYANSLAAPTGVETVPLLATLPKDTTCTKPQAGYPVMIFQHGITSNRTAMIGIADTMGSVCHAVISMDLPIHGIAADDPIHQGLQLVSGGLLGIFEGYAAGGVRERTFGVDYINNLTGAPGPDGVADPSGAHTINLTNLQASRDNGRQAILDLLALEKAIPFMDIDGDGTPDLDVANIKFMGHSLGGIIGTGFVAQSDFVQSAVLANPGGGIARLLDASLTFGPRIRAGLAAAGIEAGTPDYDLFLFATQTVVDSFDPISYTGMANMNNIPTLMFRTLDDAVVPNNVPTAPLSGTDPLAAYLGLTTIAPTEPGPIVGSRFYSRINMGDHASVLSPAASLEATVEMQTQIASFLASGGTAVTVADPSLVE